MNSRPSFRGSLTRDDRSSSVASTSISVREGDAFRLTNADFAGYIYRLSNKWKRRFFVLEGRELSYYGSETEAMEPSTPPKGRILVCGAYYWGEVNCGLIIASASGEVWKCYAEMTNASEKILPPLTKISEDCRALAMNLPTTMTIGDMKSDEVMAIRQTCNPKSVDEFKYKLMCVPMRHNEVAMKGWVEKRGSRFRSWKRRYFVLRENLLAYYDINLEGQPQKGGDIVQAIENSTVKANGLEFKMLSGRSLVGFTESPEDHVQWLQASQNLHHP
ncbi:Aste57867_12938 [Aphanomyces stellatus]|uniref:Aste57867_12938 protein n=1 Tax=Aphanomyces stellatus TaxID=120398 RepID=A0A485KWW5_9STRA|nr:hypothetical protein As57867_012890 [Aphanomyces stellatus]VFT89784.1 Aste57867_12938 [Aphanomyces stellatus]